MPPASFGPAWRQTFTVRWIVRPPWTSLPAARSSTTLTCSSSVPGARLSSGAAPPDPIAVRLPGGRSAGTCTCARSLVAPLCQVHVFELEGLLVELGLGNVARPAPGGGVGEVVVVTQRFAVLGLVLDPEVTAAGLLAVQRVAHEQLGELEEVGHATGLLEGLVER